MESAQVVVLRQGIGERTADRNVINHNIVSYIVFKSHKQIDSFADFYQKSTLLFLLFFFQMTVDYQVFSTHT